MKYIKEMSVEQGYSFIPYGIPVQPYKIPIKYPDPRTAVNWQGDSRPEDIRRPFGYQPKRKNPGDLKFAMYDYPFQTSNGVPLTHPGKGWYHYEKTGKYYQSWER